MIYTWKLNFALLLSHFLVNLSTRNIDKVVSMLFSQHRWTCVDSTFLFNLIPTLKQHWVINIEITSTNIRRLNFHFQPNINVETTLMNVDDQRCFNVDLRLMCLLKDSNGKQKQFVDFFVIPELYIIISSTQFGTNEIVILRI